MKVLVPSIGSRGDVQPIVALALEFKARGHVAAVVHHGGAGTTAAAARAGKGQVIVQGAVSPSIAARAQAFASRIELKGAPMAVDRLIREFA